MKAWGPGRPRSCRRFAWLIVLPVLVSCSGVQSALDPAGAEAAQVAALFWTMALAGLAIWACVIAVSLYAAHRKRGPISDGAAGQIIIWAGVVFPVTVLTALLTYALWLMPSLRPFAGVQQATFRIEVTGHQFWWRVVYRRADGTSVTSANEVRLPVGTRVEFALASADMIHSFWIPSLGGKMDLIPGRTNRLSLLATKPGVYRGQCAEFCGTGHALMAFPAIVMEPGDFQAWLKARDRHSTDPQVGEGRAVFDRHGCGKCHSVDGVGESLAGPDLSHIGSRETVGAGLLPNTPDNLARFIADAPALKPGIKMPSYP